VNRLLSWLARTNERIAVAAGIVLLVSVAVTLFDIIARPFQMSLGGTDELSGYAMAIATSWGIGYALTDMAHVRVVVAYRVWPVLAKTIKFKSTANTTLETPLWIPQSLWLAGWMWFAISSVIIAISVLIYIASGNHDKVKNVAGMRNQA